MVAVAGVDGPVTARLAAGYLVPFTVGGRIRVTGQREPTTPDDGSRKGKFCDVD